MTLRTLTSTNPPQGVLRKGKAWGCEGVAGPWRHVPGSREPAAARSFDWSQWWRRCRRPGRWLSWVGPLHVLSPSPGWESKEAFYTQSDQTAGRKSEVRRGLSEPSYTPHATHIKGVTVCAHMHVSTDHLPPWRRRKQTLRDLAKASQLASKQACQAWTERPQPFHQPLPPTPVQPLQNMWKGSAKHLFLKSMIIT